MNTIADVATAVVNFFKAFFVGTTENPSVVSSVFTVVMDNPIILAFILLPLVGLGIGLAFRLLRRR